MSPIRRDISPNVAGHNPIPSQQNALVVEAWAQGYMVGSLIIMAFITIANMRRGVVLHKVSVRHYYQRIDTDLSAIADSHRGTCAYMQNRVRFLTKSTAYFRRLARLLAVSARPKCHMVAVCSSDTIKLIVVAS